MVSRTWNNFRDPQMFKILRSCEWCEASSELRTCNSGVACEPYCHLVLSAWHCLVIHILSHVHRIVKSMSVCRRGTTQLLPDGFS